VNRKEQLVVALHQDNFKDNKWLHKALCYQKTGEGDYGGHI